MTPVIQRLYPAGYRDDPDAAAEFRSLDRDRVAQRAGRADRGLPRGSRRRRPDRPDRRGHRARWLRVLNDLRLALGTRLGVTEEAELDPTSSRPTRPPSRGVVYALVRPPMQDAVVQTLLPLTGPVTSAVTVLRSTGAIHDAIVAHARRDHPDEACGVVAGPAGSDRPERLVQMLNAAALADLLPVRLRSTSSRL